MALATDLIDVALGTTAHDLILADGDFTWTSGVAGTAQAIKIAVWMHMGEWFLDLDEGVPYFEREGVPAAKAILGQRFDAAKIQAIFAKKIYAVANVTKIVSLAASFDGVTRTLRVSWVVTTSFGDTVTDSLAMQR